MPDTYAVEWAREWLAEWFRPGAWSAERVRGVAGRMYDGGWAGLRETARGDWERGCR
jgi:hypothetical protein